MFSLHFKKSCHGLKMGDTKMCYLSCLCQYALIFNYVKTCPEPHLYFLCDEHATYNSTYTTEYVSAGVGPLCFRECVTTKSIGFVYSTVSGAVKGHSNGPLFFLILNDFYSVDCSVIVI